MKSNNAFEHRRYSEGSAAKQGLISCPVCHQLEQAQVTHCRVCGEKLYVRKPHSLQITLALLITALLFYIPANVYPIMTTTTLGTPTQNTIFGGVVVFLEHGSYFVAFVIFAASVFIPLAKISMIAWLCYCTVYRESLNHRELSRIYRITEFVGKWSMIDIFVVAVLAALVQLTGLMTIEPGIAARAFTAVVILTMIAAQQFDIRLIWDRLEQ